MYFLRGSLPWQGLKVDKREDRYKKICEKKKSTTPEELCSGFPMEFVEYITYTRHMEFEQEPDYSYLRGLLKKVMKENNWQFDNQYDWVSTSNNNNKKAFNGYVKQSTYNNFNYNCDNYNPYHNTLTNEHEINLKINNEFKPITSQILQTSNNQETYLSQRMNHNNNHSLKNSFSIADKSQIPIQNQTKDQEIYNNTKEPIKSNENGLCLIY